MIPSFDGVRVLVLGDCILDRYVQGSVNRISPEAPVPVVDIQRRDSGLGGAGNVAAGIAALNAAASLVGIVGADQEGRTFRELAAAAGISAEGLAVTDETSTVCKTRVVAERNQQLLRLDEDGDAAVRRRLAIDLIPATLERLRSFDAVVLSDYEKGTLPAELIQAVIAGGRARGIPIIVDPKKRDFACYRGATVVTPNRLELERACDRPLSSLAEVTAAAETVRERYGIDFLACTCGADGIVLASPQGTIRLPTDSVAVSDVSGAGDTVVATLAAALGAGQSVESGCRWAQLAAGVAVSYPRVRVIVRSELVQAAARAAPKMIARTAVGDWAERQRRAGRRIVFSNGCFDVLHAGHLSYLEQAKRLGDVLLVALNSDASVRRLKGASRPRVHQDHRATLLSGLACIDAVVVFDEDTPEALIRTVRPDSLVKGGDYAPSQIVGADFVREYGGQVFALPLLSGLSTTAILGDR